MSNQLTFLGTPRMPWDVVGEKLRRAFIAREWKGPLRQRDGVDIDPAPSGQFGNFQSQPRMLSSGVPVPGSRCESKDRLGWGR